MHSFYLDQIRQFEGFTPKASWDYAQFTNGYGTKARFAGEVISTAEAERRFQAEVSSARSIVETAAPGVDEGTKAALTSLTYNAGTSWIESGLGDAVRRGDLDQAREIFQKYNKAGGEVLPGLVNRRTQEAMWIGNPGAVAPGGGTPVELASAESADMLPPVVVDSQESTARVAEMLSRMSAPGSAGAETRPGFAFEREPRTERMSIRNALASVANEALAALVDIEQLGPGGVADVTRLAQLGRGSELAGTDRDSQDKQARRAGSTRSA